MSTAKNQEPDYNRDKVDDATLALLYLVMWQEGKPFPYFRAWKGFDWDTLDRLHAKGFIEDPQNKNKSVFVTEEGHQRAEELFYKLFGINKKPTE